jgi:hypothetical protein
MKAFSFPMAGCLLALGWLTSPGRGVAAEPSEKEAFTPEERALCERLALKNQPWAGIRWEVSLAEARDRAERERKPVFLVVNTGNVLGFV